jgi:hypothetical protein
MRAPLTLSEVRGKFLKHNAGQLGADPTRLDEQIVDICERLNASFNGSFKTIGRVGMRKIYGGLDGGEDVLVRC